MRSREYLATLHANITPTDTEVRDVQDTVNRVLVSTREHLRLAEVRPAGSWEKGTMLRGRQEADIIAILADAPNDATLDRLATHFDDTLTGLRRRPETSHKAVNLHFMNGVSIDLLPTARDGRTAPGASVPRKLRHAWHGVHHVQWLKDHAHGTVTHQVIRLAKHLRNCHAGDFHGMSSFAIEVMCVEMGLAGNLGDAFEAMLQKLAGGWLDGRRLLDPADRGNDLLSDFAAGDRRDIARRAAAALAAAEAGTWSAVFPTDSGSLPPPAGNLGGRTLG